MASRIEATRRWANRRALTLVAAVLVAAGAERSAAAEPDVSRDLPIVQGPVAVGPRRQLLVDDVIVESMQDLRRTYHQVTKYAQNPIMVPEEPWETQARSLLPLTVLRDAQLGTLRVWYSAWGKQVDKPTFMCVADSRDGIHWERPNLGLLKVYDTVADRCDIQLAFSRNAKHWQRPERTPFLPNSPQKGQWDYGNLDPAGDPIRVGDQLWFFYSGRSTLHNQKPTGRSRPGYPGVQPCD